MKGKPPGSTLLFFLSRANVKICVNRNSWDRIPCFYAYFVNSTSLISIGNRPEF
jgi:hypothetical protein